MACGGGGLTAQYLQQEVRLGVWAVELLCRHGPGELLGEFPVEDVLVVPHGELREFLREACMYVCTSHL